MDAQLVTQVAKQMALDAGQILKDGFHQIKSLSYKGKSDIVTDVDLRANELIHSIIKQNFPGHSILSEETGLEKHHSRYVWIIDPLDGTINYYYGSPPFRVGVCLLEDKKPILTAIYNPVKDVLFFAKKGQGATANDVPIRVNTNAELAKSIIMTHLSSKRDARVKTITALDSIFSQVMHMRMFGSGLAAMSYVAEGKFDVFFNVQTNPWDILPGALLIEEAGGSVTDIQGNPITHNSTSVLATNGQVHAEMLRLLSHV
jgi:myo-inositol-1(or 4)-monophosphatase